MDRCDKPEGWRIAVDKSDLAEYLRQCMWAYGVAVLVLQKRLP